MLFNMRHSSYTCISYSGPGFEPGDPCWNYSSIWAIPLPYMETHDEFLSQNNFFYFSTKTYVVGTQKTSQWDGSFEYPKQMLKVMDKKAFTILHQFFFSRLVNVVVPKFEPVTY